MDRTLRNPQARAALYRLAEGKCQGCGCELPEDWHADHVVSWANGGETDIANMQALCPKCNLKKGAGPFQLRQWQKDAVKKLASRDRDFFVEATPGAGKTKFSCHVAESKFRSSECEKLIVVVPTTSLKEQWTDDLHGIQIDAEPYFKSGAWPKGFHAICVTYQQVASDPATLRHFCSTNRVMVIFDEIHHCGEDANWGQAIRFAFERAAFRLALSGTPFRSDSNAIPFLRYIDGKAQPDHIYGYGEALHDNIVRHVFFPRIGGRMEWSTPQGRVLTKTFDDELKESEANQRLRTALTTGEWLPGTLQSANELLMQMRETDKDAGGLVIAMDQFHARKVQRSIASMFGIEADVVLSDDPDAQAKLSGFKSSSRPWVVAVKMVSEGVDIPRLRVGVYATNTTTEMFFRQAVGRFVRVEKNHDDPTASVFIPDDPRLRAFAEEIRQQRVHELEKELEQEQVRGDGEGAMDHDASYFLALNSTGESKGTIVDDVTITNEELEVAAKYAMGQCKPEIAAAILKRCGFFSADEKVSPEPKTERKADKKRRLKSLIQKVIGQICYTTGETHQDMHYRLNQVSGIQSTKDASIEQLEKKLSASQKRLALLGAGNAKQR